jgi:FRG domain
MILPDGFVPIQLADLKDLSRSAGVTVDEVSPFADRHHLARGSDELILDRQYGLAYHSMQLDPAAIWARTSDLPSYSGDHLANFGFLRVPFRRIPRRIVHSRAEIEDLLAVIKSADPNLRMLFRGQTNEYLIKRSPETSRWLFGEDGVSEPSLGTSASRRHPALEHVLPEWSALLNIFMIETGMQGQRDYEDLFGGYGLPLFALALAQHYGLPTSGLDVTDSLDVGLFFALMKFKKLGSGFRAAYSRETHSDVIPVLYLLFPPEQQQFGYEQFGLESFLRGRPHAQAARFMHMGWGHAVNACAERIFLALYLDPSGDFDPIPSPAQLFPRGADDPFGNFLEHADMSRFPDTFKQVLEEGFYTIA